MTTISTSVRTAVAAACLAGAAAVHAGVVTFDTLSGDNGDPFTTITEDGITVNTFTGDWQQAFNVGNPIPGLFTFSPTASLEVLTGGLFGFVGFDLSTGGVSSPDYAFEGFLGGVSQYLFSGNPNTGTGVFTSIVNAWSDMLVDRVEIRYTLTSTSGNIDNIRTADSTPVPEPGTLALLLAALGAGAVVRRRRAS
jgi:hypothetical protein